MSQTNTLQPLQNSLKSIESISKQKQHIPSDQSKQSDNFTKKIYYSEKDYFKTKSKNLISKRCLIKSSDNIEIYDHAILMQKIILRADLAKIFIGRYVILSQGVIIKPPFKKQHNQIRHIPVEIGSYVFIDKGTIIQAMKIGSYVKIGKDCIIGARASLGDCCMILDGTIVPADAQLAASSVYGGKPAMYMGEITQSASIIQKYACVSYFQNFLEIKGPEMNQTKGAQVNSAKRTSELQKNEKKQTIPQKIQ